MADKGWIIAYHDPASEDFPQIFLSEESAKARVAELLQSLARGLQPADFVPKEDYERDVARVQATIRGLLMQGKVWEALGEWDEYVSEFGPMDETLFVNKTDVFE